jgi:HEPN domain-containing protein
LTLSKSARKWFRYALEDLKVARALEPLGASHRRACVYHCQQSAEKAIKGYLTQHQKRFPKTHNIAELVDIISLVEPIIARKLHGAKRLTKYAIEYRYPGAASRPLTRAQAKSAINSVNTIYDLITHHLQQLKR